MITIKKQVKNCKKCGRFCSFKNSEFFCKKCLDHHRSYALAKGQVLQAVSQLVKTLDNLREVSYNLDGQKNYWFINSQVSLANNCDEEETSFSLKIGHNSTQDEILLEMSTRDFEASQNNYRYGSIYGPKIKL